jgi:hypothetical protein
MKFNDVLEWLRKYEFNIQHSEHFYSRDYVFCKKDQTNIVLKEYDDISPNQIRSDSVDIRSILNELHENVWNTYFLITSSSDKKLIPYSLEKDSIGIRKYVINTLDDIKRIPFLDIITMPIGGYDTSNIMLHTNKSQNLNTIIDHIISFDGLQRDLAEDEVSEIVSKLLYVRVNKNEN